MKTSLPIETDGVVAATIREISESRHNAACLGLAPGYWKIPGIGLIRMDKTEDDILRKDT